MVVMETVLPAIHPRTSIQTRNRTVFVKLVNKLVKAAFEARNFIFMFCQLQLLIIKL